MATVLSSLGEQYICDFLSGVSVLDAEHIGWGTGVGTALKADTTLDTESAESRVVGTMSVTGSGATAKFQVVGTITSAGSQTIVNAGLFDASTTGTLILHGDFSGVALVSGDKIEFTFTLDPA